MVCDKKSWRMRVGQKRRTSEKKVGCQTNSSCCRLPGVIIRIRHSQSVMWLLVDSFISPSWQHQQTARLDHRALFIPAPAIFLRIVSIWFIVFQLDSFYLASMSQSCRLARPSIRRNTSRKTATESTRCKPSTSCILRFIENA